MVHPSTSPRSELPPPCMPLESHPAPAEPRTPPARTHEKRRPYHHRAPPTGTWPPDLRHHHQHKHTPPYSAARSRTNPLERANRAVTTSMSKPHHAAASTTPLPPWQRPHAHVVRSPRRQPPSGTRSSQILIHRNHEHQPAPPPRSHRSRAPVPWGADATPPRPTPAWRPGPTTPPRDGVPARRGETPHRCRLAIAWPRPMAAMRGKGGRGGSLLRRWANPPRHPWERRGRGKAEEFKHNLH